MYVMRSTIIVLTIIMLILFAFDNCIGLQSRLLTNWAGIILLRSLAESQTYLLSTLPKQLPFSCVPIEGVKNNTVFNKWGDRLIASPENSTISPYILGTLYLSLCKLDEAESSYQKAINNNHQDIISLSALGTANLYQHDVTQAIRNWEAAGATKNLIDFGTSQMNTENWTGAEAAFSAALRLMDQHSSNELSPLRSVVLAGRGWADYRLNGDYKNGKAMLLQALALDPKYLFTLVYLGDIEYEHGELDLARTWYLKAHEVDINHITPMFKLSLVALNQREFEEELFWLKTAVETNPQYMNTYLFLGDAYMRLGEKESAKKYYQEGRRQFPNEKIFLERLISFENNE